MATLAIVAPLLAPSIEYYREISRYDYMAVDTALRHDKRRKAVHRYGIMSGAELRQLTVPVSAPGHGGSGTPWSAWTVSGHGRWHEVMRGTLHTVYRPTPWFDAVWPAVQHLYTEHWVGQSVTDYVLAMDAAIRGLLGIRTLCSVGMPLNLPADTEIVDLRRRDWDGPSVLHTMMHQGLNVI